MKRGDHGQHVRKLQLRLLKLGFERVFVNGVVRTLKADEDFGPVTQEAVASFQAKVIDASVEIDIPEWIRVNYPIDVTGIVDYPSQWVLNHYEAIVSHYGIEIVPDIIPVTYTKEKRIEEFLKVCESMVGIIEKGGNNFGKEVEHIQRLGSCDVVKNGGSPWCQFAKNFALKETVKKLELDVTGKKIEGIWCNGYTPSWVNYSRRHKTGIDNPKKSDIEPGMLGYIYSSARNNAMHVYTIVGFNSIGQLITLEGNTNPGGSADGDGYYKRVRNFTNQQCFHVVKWWELL